VKEPNIDGTTLFAIWRSSSVVAGTGSRGGGGGGGGDPGAGTAATVVADATATKSGAETLSFGSSAGAQLQPKMVQPPFSA